VIVSVIGPVVLKVWFIHEPVQVAAITAGVKPTGFFGGFFLA
jgi:hypothetical protein